MASISKRLGRLSFDRPAVSPHHFLHRIQNVFLRYGQAADEDTIVLIFFRQRQNVGDCFADGIEIGRVEFDDSFVVEGDLAFGDVEAEPAVGQALNFPRRFIVSQ